MSSAFDLEALLAHDRFVRSLAKSLVLDADRAEDLAQQAWVASLEGRPAGSALRGWLTATMRNLAAKARLADARRRERERRAARPAHVPSDAAIRDREALRREVVEAVLALEEPYKTTVVLRFLEGLPPRAVGREMGVPAETVRTRVRRALERLREALDAAHGGDRRGWCVGLAGLARESTLVPFLAGVLLVTTKTKLIAMALVLGAFSFAVWRLAREREPGLPGDAPGVPVAAAPLVAGSRPAVAATREAVAASESRAASVPAATGSLLVHARWSDGTPAQDVGIFLAAGKAKRSDELGSVTVECRTEADGDKLFTDVPVGAFDLLLGFGEFSGGTIAAGQRSEATLKAGPHPHARNVQGVVVDGQGAPVAEADVVVSIGTYGLTRWVIAAKSGADGTFELRALPVHSLIGARKAGFAPSKRAGEIARAHFDKDLSPVLRVRLVLPGPGGTVAGLVRDPSGVPIPRAHVQVGAFHYSGGLIGDNPESPVRVRTDAHGEFRCSDVPSGSQYVVVNAPGCGCWARPIEVRAGSESSVVVDLVPGVTLRGTVRGADGKPVTTGTVRLGGNNGIARWPDEVGTRMRDDGSYEFTDLAAGELKVKVSTADGGDAETRLEARPGDSLTWDVTLGPTLALEGRVVDGRGAGLQARLEARVRDANATYREGPADAKGHFRLAGLPDAPADIHVWLPGSDHVVAKVASARPGRGELVITVPDSNLPSAFFRGTVLRADGAPLAKAQVRLVRHGADGLRNRTMAVTEADTGAFQLGPIASGTWSLLVTAKDHPPLRTEPMRVAMDETADVGSLRLSAPGWLTLETRRDDGTRLLPLQVMLWQGDDFVTAISTDDKALEPIPLASGRYRLFVSGGNAACESREVVIREHETARVELVLRPPLYFDVELVLPAGDQSSLGRLKVLDAKGDPCANVLIPGPRADKLVTRLGLAPGSYRAEAKSDAGASGSVTFTIAPVDPQPTLRIPLR